MQDQSTTSVPISAIVVGQRYRKDRGDIEALAASIADVGLLHPIVIDTTNRLIAGHRRILACQALGWTHIPVTVINLPDLVRGELQENIARKDFLPSEMVAIRQALEPMEREMARARQGVRTDIVGIPHDVGKTRDRVATYAGTNARTLKEASAVVAAAAREPAKYAPLVAQMDKTGKVNGAYKQLKRQEQAETIASEPPPLPQGPFRVLVADPPWQYKKRAGDITHRAITPYPDMTIDAIKALPVGRMAADDSVLWLWTTNAHIRQAFEVLDAWGFAYKTMLTWVKDRMGTGDWLRGQTEHCLMAIKGKPTVLLTNQTTVIAGPLREHSRKPDEFYALVERLCPGAKVELFSRAQREGWYAYGNDTDAFSGDRAVEERA